MSVIDEVKDRIDIVDLVSETVKLRRAGKSYSGFCPFHDNKRTPAFAVFPESGTWRCFGQCNEGGDVFKFVMKKEGWDFAEALKYLADRVGVELKPQSPEQQEQEEQYDRLGTLLEDAVVFYRHQLLQSPQGKPALAYFENRGVTHETIETFGLGYAPASWEATMNYFLGKGYQEQELVDAGLVSERESGGFYDRFRNRLMFAIRDGRGRMAGFGARVLDSEDFPKYLNSPQTALFDKGRLLYGLDLARKTIRQENEVVIVEGYMDVIVPYQAGFTNAVSPMGTALTEDHLRMLKRYARRFILALDADAAGEKATMRGLEIARQTLNRSDEIVFDARGLIRHEGRLQADVRITTIPDGMDPDEVVLRDPDEWRAILAAAKPVVAHVMDTLAAQKDLTDPKVKREIADQILPLIGDIADPIERDTYRQRLARLLRVDERTLVPQSPIKQRPTRRKPKIEQAVTPIEKKALKTHSSGQLAIALERHVLRLLIREPQWLNDLDRFLQKNDLNRLDVQDFEHADHQLLSRLIIQSLEQDQVEPDLYVREQVTDDVKFLVDELDKENQKGNQLEERMKEDLMLSLMKLRLLRVNEGMQQMHFMLQVLMEEGERSLNPYQEMITRYTQLRRLLDKALGTPIQLD
ncbi:MAG: DNA primase [Anaerolineaceae bacterium]|nr:DNA primase [Anaerolineaceae bacterium]